MNYTMKQILHTIEYGTKEPVASADGSNVRRDGSVFFSDFRQAEAQRVKVLNAMGVTGTKSKVPVEAHGECSYDGVLVMDQYVSLKYTLKPSRALGLARVTKWPHGEDAPKVRQKVSTHRLFVRCPWCLTDQPIGRIHQHLGSKPCKAGMAKVYGKAAD